MRYSNKYNLPASLVSVLTKDNYNYTGDISVTGLIAPPRIYQLRKRHADKIEVDVIDQVWKVLGSSIHSLLERADTYNAISEERLTCEVGGWKISGAIDLYEPGGIISDYKITSVWTVINEAKEEWIQQLNCYGHLYKIAGFDVNKLRIVAILRDWSQHQVIKSDTYPKCQIKVIDIPMWSLKETQDFLYKRITLHQQCVDLSDDDLPECTAEERWDKPEKWALMKSGRKSAIKLFDSIIDYEDYCLDSHLGERYYSNNKMTIILNKDYRIEYRAGERVRCKSYCDVKQFCRHGRNL